MLLHNHNPSNSPHLSPAELDVLLSDDEESAEFHAAAAHIDSCQACQSRLTSLAADDSTWRDTQSLLNGPNEPRWEPDTSQLGVALSRSDSRSSPLAHDLVLQLLGTPQHPEMLGRLGRYDIERVIGSGGMGVVLKAHDSELNRPIAIKLLAPHLAHVGAARERFAREGRAAAAVVHEHVVAIYGVESTGPLPFLVMQFVPGRSLEARVADDGPLAVEEILRIGVQAAAGLAAAHRQGLVHRDVKPANILLENSVERAVLTDFGLARAIDDASLTQTGILAGTPHYMSPEQATGGPIDFRSDLFSLGAVLYFMATGHPPFRGASALGVLHCICHGRQRPVWQVNKDIPDELSDMIDQLLEKKPARRFASADDVQQRLAALLAHAQHHGLNRRRWRLWRGVRQRRRWAWAAGIALAVAAIGGGVRWLGGATVDRADTQTAEPGVVATQPTPSEQARTAEDTAQLRISEREYGLDLGAALDALDASSEQARFLRGSDDVWNHELEAVRSELIEIESATGTISKSPE